MSGNYLLAVECINFLFHVTIAGVSLAVWSQVPVLTPVGWLVYAIFWYIVDLVQLVCTFTYSQRLIPAEMMSTVNRYDVVVWSFMYMAYLWLSDLLVGVCVLLCLAHHDYQVPDPHDIKTLADFQSAWQWQTTMIVSVASNWIGVSVLFLRAVHQHQSQSPTKRLLPTKPSSTKHSRMW
jgi:hypothetical protein